MSGGLLVTNTSTSWMRDLSIALASSSGSPVVVALVHFILMLCY